MKFVFSTGGREKYFKVNTHTVGDCVCRAIANATGIDYLEVYNGINEEASKEHKSKRKRKTSSARNGVYTATAKRYIERVLGWKWVPCMGIGTGCQVHVAEGELPSEGAYILNLSGHFSCWKDNQLYDTYDCSRHGTRCVYGYWKAPTEQEVKERQEQQDELARVKAMEQQAIEETKAKVNAIKKQHEPTLKKLEKKLKEIKHSIVVETNRMKREIAKVKEQDGNSFINKWLDHEEQRLVACSSSKKSGTKKRRFTL